jgi:CheY-like chemotaxis protein
VDKILIVEDSKVFLSIIQKQITLELGVECESAGSLKEAGHVLETRADQFQLANTIRRFVRNKHITILAVDDSGVGRKIIRKSLEKQMFSVVEAANGQEALA